MNTTSNKVPGWFLGMVGIFAVFTLAGLTFLAAKTGTSRAAAAENRQAILELEQKLENTRVAMILTSRPHWYVLQPGLVGSLPAGQNGGILVEFEAKPMQSGHRSIDAWDNVRSIYNRKVSFELAPTFGETGFKVAGGTLVMKWLE